MRTKAKLGTTDNPFDYLTRGKRGRLTHQPNGKYKFPTDVENSLYTKLSGKAAEVKQQIETENTAKGSGNLGDNVASKDGFDRAKYEQQKLDKLIRDAQVIPSSFGIPSKLTDKTHFVITLPNGVAANEDSALAALIEKRFGNSNLFGQDKINILNAAKQNDVKIENLKVSPNNSRVVEFDINLEGLLKLQKAYIDVQDKVNADIAISDKVKDGMALNQFLLGVMTGAVTDIKDSWNTLAHPLETLQGIRDAISILSQLSTEDIKNIAAELGKNAPNLTLGQAAYGAGYAVGTVAIELLLAKGAGLVFSALGKTKAGAAFLAKIGKIGEGMDDIAKAGKAKLAKVFSDESAELALNRLRNPRIHPDGIELRYSGAAPNPEVLKDLAIVAGNVIKNGAVKFSEFSAQMVKKGGDSIKPYLEKLYRENMVELGLSKEIDETGIRAFSSTPPLEGKKDFQVHDPNQVGRTIVDIDRFEGNILWEEKSAVSGINKSTGTDETQKWISKHITKKFADLVEARKHLPDFYKDAEIGFDFITPNADAGFKNAVETEIQNLRKLNPNIKIRINWR